ncbi:uncharacterized protein LOC110407908 [Numida meleagris]|uniref:uncharacterized protein LOC110407908 n=1 Tax=Numida meleagris TaxID=8996 RepID=UPI000B3D8F53|nr:uncharacterized protein LOC110407908 [Numida meleagris]
MAAAPPPPPPLSAARAAPPPLRSALPAASGPRPPLSRDFAALLLPPPACLPSAGGARRREERREGAGPGGPGLGSAVLGGGITAGGILNNPSLLVMVFKCIVLLSEQRKSLRKSKRNMDRFKHMLLLSGAVRSDLLVESLSGMKDQVLLNLGLVLPPAAKSFLPGRKGHPGFWQHPPTSGSALTVKWADTIRDCANILSHTFPAGCCAAVIASPFTTALPRGDLNNCSCQQKRIVCTCRNGTVGGRPLAAVWVIGGEVNEPLSLGLASSDAFTADVLIRFLRGMGSRRRSWLCERSQALTTGDAPQMQPSKQRLQPPAGLVCSPKARTEQSTRMEPRRGSPCLGTAPGEQSCHPSAADGLSWGWTPQLLTVPCYIVAADTHGTWRIPRG